MIAGEEVIVKDQLRPAPDRAGCVNIYYPRGQQQTILRRRISDGQLDLVSASTTGTAEILWQVTPSGNVVNVPDTQSVPALQLLGYGL